MGKKPPKDLYAERKIRVRTGTKSSTMDSQAVLGEISRLRSEVKELRRRRYDHDEINRLLSDLGELHQLTGGAFSVKPPGRKNKWVYTFGFPAQSLIIMVERPHGNRDAIPQLWRSKQTSSAREILDRIEAELEEVE